MAGSLTGLRLETLLLGGGIDSSSLETELADVYTLGKFNLMFSIPSTRKVLLNSAIALGILLGSETASESIFSDPDILSSFAASDASTRAILSSVSGAKSILMYPDRLAYWADITDNWNRLLALVNDANSVLKQQTFSSSGTWTLPSGLAAISVLVIGGGGAGGGSYYTDTAYPGAGGGGEIAVWTADSGLPSSNVTVTVGTGGAAAAGANGGNGGVSSFGAYLTADGGIGGTNNPTGYGDGGAGGGADSGGGAAALITTNVLNSPWQPESCSIQGGEGKDAYNSEPDTENGIGERGGQQAVGSYYVGIGGTLGAGGGQGSGAAGTGYDYSGLPGSNGGGGGAAARSNAGPPYNFAGGAGGAGKVIVSWLEPVA